MEFNAILDGLRRGGPAGFPANATTRAFAKMLDSQDPLRHLKDQFIFPTKSSLKKKALNGRLPGSDANEVNGASSGDEDHTRAIYFCGNSLGLQPKAVRKYIDAQLETWASIGVAGHFTTLQSSPLALWQDMAGQCAKQSADIAGASPDEIVIMSSLTVNIHLLMASFYRPTEKRHKIILEWKPFPSDWYAIDSQIRWHGHDPAKSMIEIQPDENFYISTDKILATIDEHADETALILLPGLQYYSGQVFDIPRITKHAQDRGITVGWDLAHAAGNIPLRLHDWNVDFAMWCTYKYLNAGPGAIAGAFVHARHGGVELDPATGEHKFRHRLAGWYGGDQSVRFNMAKEFQPTPGAQGFQVSNPSALDLAALSASLSVFNMTSMAELRAKSLVLTGYAEFLLGRILDEEKTEVPSFRIITPRNPDERGAQLSVLVRPELLEKVGSALKAAGVVCDQRKPDVIRVAPAPMYNSFEDVWACVDVVRTALDLDSFAHGND